MEHFETSPSLHKVPIKEVGTVVMLILVLPRTTVKNELSFSLLRLTEPYFPSKNSQARLKHLIWLNTYKNKRDEINPQETADQPVHRKIPEYHLFGIACNISDHLSEHLWRSFKTICKGIYFWSCSEHATLLKTN